MSLQQFIRDEIDNDAARQLEAEARGWLSDLEWADEPDFAAMPGWQVKRGIERHYEGGWAAFVAAS